MGQYLYLKGLNVNTVLLSVINYIHTDFKATFLGARHHARISLISYLILTIFQEVLLSHLKVKITKGQRDYIICSRSIVISSQSRHVALISTKIENSFYLKKKRHKAQEMPLVLFQAPLPDSRWYLLLRCRPLGMRYELLHTSCRICELQLLLFTVHCWVKHVYILYMCYIYNRNIIYFTYNIYYILYT